MNQHSFLTEILTNGSPVVIVAGILFIIWYSTSKAYLRLYREQMKQMNESLMELMKQHAESNRAMLSELTTYIHEDHKTKTQIAETLSRLEVKVDLIKERKNRNE
jgi:DNA mismatch repair ATPase MutS